MSRAVRASNRRTAPRRSSTERAIGPGESWLGTSGTTPVRLTSPTLGLKPKTDETLAGVWIEFCVSLPIAIGASDAATAAAEPTLEPRPRPYAYRRADFSPCRRRR